jgi:predicted metalloprotease with PDZ domain
MKNTKNLIFAIAVIFATPVAAQNNQEMEPPSKSENITIETNINGKISKMELRNGQMFVDGEKVEANKIRPNLKMMNKLRRGMKLPNGANTEIEIEIPESIKEADIPDEIAKKPILGVTTKTTAENNGAEIVQVSPNSPAQIIGLQAGDIITNFGNIEIKTPSDLADAVSKFKTTDNVNIIFNRNGESKTEIVDLSGANINNNANSFDNNPFGNNFFGDGNPFEDLMKIFKEKGSNLPENIFDNLDAFKVPNANNPKIGAQVEERADNNGVRVIAVTPNSIADKAGLKVDDIISTFGGKTINGLNDLTSAISGIKNIPPTKANKKDVVVSIIRAKETKTLYLEFPVELRKQEF